jgi:DNA-binding response OmpR family regulator
MAKGRILLAHANSDCQKIYGSVLAYEGYKVDVAADVDAALAFISSAPVDLVVTDLYLPSEADECLLRRMRSSMASHLPVIVLTGWTTELHRQVALAEGADRFLALPLRPRELVAMIGEMLGQSKEPQHSVPFAPRRDQSVANGI